MLSHCSPCGAHVQFDRPSSILPSQSTSRLLHTSVCGVGSHTPPWHVPATFVPAEFATVHASPGFLPLQAATPALQNRPVPSDWQRVVPLTRQMPGRLLLQLEFLPGKSSSTSTSQSSSRPLHDSVLIASSRMFEIASWRLASSDAYAPSLPG